MSSLRQHEVHFITAVKFKDFSSKFNISQSSTNRVLIGRPLGIILRFSLTLPPLPRETYTTHLQHTNNVLVSCTRHSNVVFRVCVQYSLPMVSLH